MGARDDERERDEGGGEVRRRERERGGRERERAHGYGFEFKVLIMTHIVINACWDLLWTKKKQFCDFFINFILIQEYETWYTQIHSRLSIRK